MPTLPAETLRHVAWQILKAVGTPTESAAIVSESLVEANLLGHDSHGVMLLMYYASSARSGQVKPDAYPTLQARHGATAQIDGGWGWGQLAARLAVQTAIELAGEHGISAVTIGRCNHIGRLGEYVEMIARSGMVGMALCNSGAAVAPYGGRQPLLGTNPLACALPTNDDESVLLVDFATSGVAEGKLRVAVAKGERVPLGLVVDREGRSSNDPQAYYQGGAMLPFGGHKGYGLNLMIDLLGGALSGMAPGSSPNYGRGNGTLFLVLNVSAFAPLAQFISEEQALRSRIKASPPAEGFNQVLLPGEPEIIARRQRLAEGIPVPDKTWNDIQALRAELKIAD